MVEVPVYKIKEWLEQHKCCHNEELGKMFKVSGSRIQQVRTKFGLTYSKVRRGEEREVEIVCKLAQSGRNWSEIEKEAKSRWGISEELTNSIRNRYIIKRLFPYEAIDDLLLLRIVRMGNISAWKIAYLLGGVKHKKLYFQKHIGRKVVTTNCTLTSAVVRKLQKYNIKLRRGIGLIEFWDDPSRAEKHLQKLFRSVRKKPTKLEKLVDKISPSNVCYAGDRKALFRFKDGHRWRWKNPDFVIEGQNKVIEAFGSYWHSEEEEPELIKAFKGIGIKCLVVWENDVRNNIEWGHKQD